jgi:hypothetical protein
MKLSKELIVELIEEVKQEIEESKFNTKYTNDTFDIHLSEIENMMNKGYFKTKTEQKNSLKSINRMIGSAVDKLLRELPNSDDNELSYALNLSDARGITAEKMKILKGNGLNDLATFFENIKAFSLDIKSYPIGAENKKSGNIDPKYNKFYDVVKSSINAIQKNELLSELQTMWDEVISKASKGNPKKPKGKESTMGWKNVNILPTKPTTFSEMTAYAWKTAGLKQEISDAEIIKELNSIIKKKKPTATAGDDSNITDADKVINWISERLNASIPEIVDSDTKKIIKQVADYKIYKEKAQKLSIDLVKEFLKNATDAELKGVSRSHSKESIGEDKYIKFTSSTVVSDADDKIRYDGGYDGAQYSWGRKEKKVTDEYKAFLDSYNSQIRKLKNKYGVMDGINQFVRMDNAKIKEYVEENIQDKIERQINSSIKKIKQRNIVEVTDGTFDSSLSIFDGDGFHWTVKDNKGDNFDLHFRAIWAGGYNIQPLHIRSILTIKKVK